MKSQHQITKLLKEKNIKPSIIRIKVLSYILEHKDHPTVDMIYNALKDELPTLSKTSIYNTLTILCDSGLVKVRTIDKNETRFDTVLDCVEKDHGHFKCNICNNVYDFNIKIDILNADYLNDFTITQRDVFFYGVCDKCNLKQNLEGEEKNKLT